MASTRSSEILPGVATQSDRTLPLELTVLGVRVHIEIDGSGARGLLSENFGQMLRPADQARPEIEYRVSSGRGGYRVAGGLERGADGDHDVSFAVDAYELIYELEKRLTVDLQHVRSDLLFVHAAALELEGRAFLLAAPPGSGKSTTAWSLVNQGFGYLSDELAPVDVRSMSVQPYPHAICLKADPPDPFGLPHRVLRTSRTAHIPADVLSRVVAGPVPLAVLIFNTYDASALEPGIRRLSSGEAGVRLYANALNHLAHPNAGLATVARITRETAAFCLTTTRDLNRCGHLLAAVLTEGSRLPISA